MASINSFWIFSLALLILASPLLQVARCQSDSDEAVQTTEEAGDIGIVRDNVQDFGDATFTSAPGIDTISVFPKNSAKLVKAGVETELLVGVKNNGESSLNVVAIKASVHLPFDHRMLVQNLTAQVFNKGSVPAPAQATFPYIFAVSKFLQPGNFDLVVTIVYEINEQPYQSTFYNGTIEVVESGSPLGSKEYVILFQLGVIILLLFWVLIHSLIQNLSEKTKRAPEVEVGTRSTDASTEEWLEEAREQRTITLPELHRYLHMREDIGEFATDRARNIQESFQGGLAEYHESQQSSGVADIDPVEEARVARDIWERAVGPQKSNRMVGSSGIGPAAFRTSIIPSLSASHSGSSSTGSSYVPNAGELNAVTQLTQQLSAAQRQFAERQEQNEREVQALREKARITEERMEEQARLVVEQARLAAEQARLNEERFKFLQDQLMSQHSRPSSSHMPSYLSQHYGGAFQQWPQQQYAPQYSQQYAPQPYQPYQQPQQQSPHQSNQPNQHPQRRSPQQPHIDLNIDAISAFLASDDTYYHGDDTDLQPPQ